MEVELSQLHDYFIVSLDENDPVMTLQIHAFADRPFKAQVKMFEFMEDFANNFEGEKDENGKPKQRVTHQFVKCSLYDLKHNPDYEPGIYFVKNEGADNKISEHELLRVHSVVKKSLYAEEGYMFNAVYKLESLRVFFLQYAEPKKWTLVVSPDIKEEEEERVIDHMIVEDDESSSELESDDDTWATDSDSDIEDNPFKLPSLKLETKEMDDPIDKFTKKWKGKQKQTA